MSALPESIRESVEAGLGERGLRGGIDRVRPVGGGCINNGAHLTTRDGSSAFLKWNAGAPDGFFRAEAAGLRTLRRCAESVLSSSLYDAPLVPEPFSFEDDPTAVSWLLMEYIEPGPATGEAWAGLGHGLAALHSAPIPAAGHGQEEEDSARGADPLFGWEHDNWIGTLRQRNEPADWGAFWRDRRIVPQLEEARAEGHVKGPEFDRLVDLIPTALGGVTTPALVHGDLWSGNSYTTAGERPVLVDPAVYRGDREVDLAMSELFGGFGQEFYRAYWSIASRTDEYSAYRRDLYQLYYLLVHVNLFGASYEAGAVGAARRVVAVLA